MPFRNRLIQFGLQVRITASDGKFLHPGEGARNSPSFVSRTSLWVSAAAHPAASRLRHHRS